MVLRLWEDFVDGDEALEEIEAAEFSYAAEVSTMEGVCGGCDGDDARHLVVFREEFD